MELNSSAIAVFWEIARRLSWTGLTPDAAGICANCVQHELLHNRVAIQPADGWD